MNNMITGGTTAINLATTAFGQDLINLGQLINLRNLNDLGSPLALIQQIYSITGTIPVVSIYFVAVGIPTNVVLNLTDAEVSVTDAIQGLMYRAMTQITGNNLAQILSVLGVTTVGITTMADLLNPVKLFPNSFQSLTVPTKYGERAIYVNESGSVNTALKTELPLYVMSSLV
jgi:type IV secretory pathway VirB2 component (pilin)